MRTLLLGLSCSAFAMGASCAHAATIVQTALASSAPHGGIVIGTFNGFDPLLGALTNVSLDVQYTTRIGVSTNYIGPGSTRYTLNYTVDNLRNAVTLTPSSIGSPLGGATFTSTEPRTVTGSIRAMPGDYVLPDIVWQDHYQIDPSLIPNFVGSGTLLASGSQSYAMSGLIDPVPGFSSVSSPSAFLSDSLTLTYTYAPADAVPEPASWAMMVGGFGIVGGMLRARRRRGALRA